MSGTTGGSSSAVSERVGDEPGETHLAPAGSDYACPRTHAADHRGRQRTPDVQYGIGVPGRGPRPLPWHGAAQVRSLAPQSDGAPPRDVLACGRRIAASTPVPRRTGPGCGSSGFCGDGDDLGHRATSGPRPVPACRAWVRQAGPRLCRTRPATQAVRCVSLQGGGPWKEGLRRRRWRHPVMPRARPHDGCGLGRETTSHSSQKACAMDNSTRATLATGLAAGYVVGRTKKGSSPLFLRHSRWAGLWIPRL